MALAKQTKDTGAPADHFRRERFSAAPASAEAQNLVELLQNHIAERYYQCTKQILAGLGQMYAADERFRNNIDKHADGTAADRFCRRLRLFLRK